MIEKMRNMLITLTTLGALLFPTMVPIAVYADGSSTVNGSSAAACQGIGLTGANCNSDSGTASNKIYGLFSTIANVLSVLVGAVAVIMIIVGGFKYVTSGGDSNNISGAKNTIIYAIVGLIIVALAQFIVHFVLKQVQ